MRIISVMVLMVTLSGCTLTGFSMEQAQQDGMIQPTGVITFPKDRVFMGTAYDCTTYEKRAVFGYKLYDFSTSLGEFAIGPLAADNYAGAYVARKTSFWEYWMMAYAGYDIDDETKSFGIGYMKTF